MILTSKDNFDKERMELVIFKIKDTKHKYDGILSKDIYFKGRRYEDNERIAIVLVSVIFEECEFDLEKAKMRFLSLNSEQIEPYIKQAVLMSAESDYYYTFEKDWGV